MDDKSVKPLAFAALLGGSWVVLGGVPCSKCSGMGIQRGAHEQKSCDVVDICRGLGILLAAVGE